MNGVTSEPFSPLAILEAELAELEQRLAQIEEELQNPKLIALPLTKPWENFGGADHTADYSRDPTGFVRVTGLVKLPAGTKYAYGGGNSKIATLPVGFRPEKTVYFSMFTNTGTVKLLLAVFVNSAGEIIIGEGASETTNEGNCAYLTLAGIGFYAGLG